MKHCLKCGTASVPVIQPVHIVERDQASFTIVQKLVCPYCELQGIVRMVS